MFTSAVTYGRSWPMHTASFTYGENFSLFSTYLGAKIVPPASRVTSFARSMILRWPAGSRNPASPERIQPPSSITCRVASSFLKRSEEHTSELQSLTNLVCRLLLEKKNKNQQT